MVDESYAVSLQLLLRSMLVSGGDGLGASGVGYGIDCGNVIVPPVGAGLPLDVQEVTLLVEQAPTPVRGVDKLP